MGALSFARAALLGAFVIVAGVGHALAPSAGPNWPDTYATKLKALALLQTLNAELLSHDSATATLTQWCAAHHLTDDPHIVAVRLRGDPKPPAGEIRELLRVDSEEPIRYRHVQLKCGALVLSEADNWYVPARLTAAMNQQLDTTDTPFGIIVQEKHFQRHTLLARLLWEPLPAGWEMNAPPAPPAGTRLAIPEYVLEHRAVLSTPDGTPFSALVETYTANVLSFPAPVGER